MKTDDFDFKLPPELIANSPARPRDSARLLAIGSRWENNATTMETLPWLDRRVSDLPDLLRPGDLMVFNDTKVIPAQFFASLGNSKVEFTLHQRQSDDSWIAFAKPAKKFLLGTILRMAADFSCRVQEKMEMGQVLLRFDRGGAELSAAFARHGHMPLPPYIRKSRALAESDAADYQTVYAAREGAVAAPTAGLHFTEALMQKLMQKGIASARVTLHVGAGTFLPVKVENIAEHKMHAEYGEIDDSAALAINRAQAEGRRIVAIGTTSLRLLESAAAEDGRVRAFSGTTDLFIMPGYRFKTARVLMTNFHLPKSTLFMLVSAFMGLDLMKMAYRHAIQSGYRFFSYGDATLLEKN